MTEEHTSNSRITIQLQIVPEDEQNADPALLEGVERDTVDALRNNGYTIQRPYTGTRGLSPVEIITLLTTAWAQKDLILADTSALITIFTPLVLIAQHIHKAYEQRVGKDIAQQHPIKITLEIDGAPISIEAADLEQAEAALKLAKRFHTNHPTIAAQVTPHSKIKTKASVPKRPARKRR